MGNLIKARSQLEHAHAGTESDTILYYSANSGSGLRRDIRGWAEAV